MSLLTLLFFFVTAAWAGTGVGTKEDPYKGEWLVADLAREIKAGDYLSYNCVITTLAVDVYDTKLKTTIVDYKAIWAVGDPIDDTPWTAYNEYCRHNTLEERQQQMFCVTDFTYSPGSLRISLSGYYTGEYGRDLSDFIEVRTCEELKTAVTNDNSAKIVLKDDIYLSDASRQYELCNTFKGVLDGDGHTIYPAHPEERPYWGTQYLGKYLFVYSDGATFRNIVIKSFRAETDEHSNWSLLTSQARNKCVFENITIDNVSIWSDYNNVGAVAGYAYDCTFSNIRISNGRFGVMEKYVGAVVGDADKCTFTNIEVNNCKAEAEESGQAGGIVGHANNCTFQDIEVKNSLIQVYHSYVGGIAGESKDSHYENCRIDDHTFIYSDGTWSVSYTGGITGVADHDEIINCVNSGVAIARQEYLGGIVGETKNNTKIENCLNTGITLKIYSNGEFERFLDIYDKQPIELRYYNGKEYSVRVYNGPSSSGKYVGGIVGRLEGGSIVSKCANIGFLACDVNESLYDSYAAGIVGWVDKSTITDCYSNAMVREDNKACGIVYAGNEGSIVKNCLNAMPGRNYAKGVTATNVIDLAQYNSQTPVVTIKALGDCWEMNVGEDMYPTPTGNRGIHDTRTIKNRYGTACLPFRVKSDEEISFYRFKGSNTDNGSVALKFEYVDEVAPGESVLFCTTTDADEPVEICISNDGDGYTTEPRGTFMPGWDFVGTFEQKTFDGALAKHIYYISGGEIRNARTTTISPYRAYFSGPNIDALNADGAKNVSFVITDDDGETTVIHPQQADHTLRTTDGKTFSVMGTEVNSGYRGIVIRNGKKQIRVH